MSDDLYTRMNQETLDTLYSDQTVTQGKATLQGTQTFKDMRHTVMPVEESHFRLSKDKMFHLTSLGIGTYKGDLSPATDLKLFNAVQESVSSRAVNYIDTSINWRYMRSQRLVAAAMKSLR